MRAAVPGLVTPYPLGGLLPAIYQEDPVTMQWTAALDEVLAPAVSTLDCMGAYVDPLLTPADFLPWLAGWFGAVLDENWPLERQRAVVARSVELYRSRGTVAGLRALLELATGRVVEIDDGGGVSWSQAPGGRLPGEAAPVLTVRVIDGGSGRVDAQMLGELVAAEKPAHVIHRVEVVDG